MKMMAKDARTRSNRPTPGRAGHTTEGSPVGMGPTTATPSSPSESAEETMMPSTTTMIVRGSLGTYRRMSSSSATLPAPSASVVRSVSGTDWSTPMSTSK